VAKTSKLYSGGFPQNVGNGGLFFSAGVQIGVFPSGIFLQFGAEATIKKN